MLFKCVLVDDEFVFMKDDFMLNVLFLIVWNFGDVGYFL